MRRIVLELVDDPEGRPRHCSIVLPERDFNLLTRTTGLRSAKRQLRVGLRRSHGPLPAADRFVVGYLCPGSARSCRSPA